MNVCLTSFYTSPPFIAVTGIEFMARISDEARKSLPDVFDKVATELGSGRSRKSLLVEPLGPEEFLEQEQILKTLGFVADFHSGPCFATDSLAKLFQLQQSLWSPVMNDILPASASALKEETRKCATILSGWHAFMQISTKNLYGVERTVDGRHLPGSCLQKLAAMSVAGINDGILDEAVSYQNPLWFLPFSFFIN